MTGKMDEVKGRLEEAAGALTDDNQLRRAGKIDQAAAKVKQAVANVIDKAKDAGADKHCCSEEKQPGQP